MSPGFQSATIHLSGTGKLKNSMQDGLQKLEKNLKSDFSVT